MKSKSYTLSGAFLVVAFISPIASWAQLASGVSDTLVITNPTHPTASFIGTYTIFESNESTAVLSPERDMIDGKGVRVREPEGS